LKKDPTALLDPMCGAQGRIALFFVVLDRYDA